MSKRLTSVAFALLLGLSSAAAYAGENGSASAQGITGNMGGVTGNTAAPSMSSSYNQGNYSLGTGSSMSGTAYGEQSSTPSEGVSNNESSGSTPSSYSNPNN